MVKLMSYAVEYEAVVALSTSLAKCWWHLYCAPRKWARLSGKDGLELASIEVLFSMSIALCLMPFEVGENVCSRVVASWLKYVIRSLHVRSESLVAT